MARRDDLAAEWRLEGVHTERLLLPPLHTLFELALLLGLPEAETLTLELVTDPRLSPHVAPFLLEQFSAFPPGSGLPSPCRRLRPLPRRWRAGGERRRGRKRCTADFAGVP